MEATARRSPGGGRASVQPKPPKWTSEEDAILTAAVHEHGPKWTEFENSGLIPGRKVEMYRKRWARLQKLAAEQALRLRRLPRRPSPPHPPARPPPRSPPCEPPPPARPSPCRRRRQIRAAAARKKAERKEWSAAEDAKIRSAVGIDGVTWGMIAAMLPGRSDDSVRTGGTG